MNGKFVKVACVAAMAMFCASPSPAYDSFGEWVNDVRGDRWQTGQLANLAATYQQHIEENGANYEARILHAATVLAQLGENKSVAAYAKKFGYTFDFLHMKANGKSSALSSWPTVNAMVDSFVNEGVPVLETALADLAGIPDDWTGSVLLSANDYSLDEDVSVDIGDVLYARAGIEAAIGMAYFAHGYDLTVDYAKGKAAMESRRMIQTLPRAPASEWDEMWKSVPAGAECEGGLYSFKVGYVGKKMYVRVEGEMDDVIEYGYHAIRSIYLSMEDSSDEPCWSLLLTDDSDGSMRQQGQYKARVFNASESDTWWEWDFSNKTVPVTMMQSNGVCQFEIDLSKFATYAKSEAWTIGWGEVWLYSEWHDATEWYDGWWNCGWSYLGSLESTPKKLYKLLTEQAKFMAKVRNQSSLATSKTWMTAALTCALAADAAVLGRTDENMHFVEYDQADADSLAQARKLTAKALASLDSPQELDVQEEIFGEKDVPSFVTLLPNDGLMQVYLGALFGGKITRDLLPTFQKGMDEGPVPVIETIKDPTIAGLLPEFTAKTWMRLVRDRGFEVAHQTVNIKLDANGGKVTKTSVALDYDDEAEDCMYPELPMPNPRAGYLFVGWASAKAGGEKVYEGDSYDASLFAGVKAPTLYAQWIKLVKLTLKDDSAFAQWWLPDDFDPEVVGWMSLSNSALIEGEGKGALELIPGACVRVSAPEETKDKKGNSLTFQKWTVSPSSANLGPDFRVTDYWAEIAMPDMDITFQAAYIDKSTCGWLSVSIGYMDPIQLNEDGEAPVLIHPPLAAFEWSPDGGKTWYKLSGEYDPEWHGDDQASGFRYSNDMQALLKAGKYTITWRSTDPNWQAPAVKAPVTVTAGNEPYIYPMSRDEQFTYVPQVVVEVMTYENGKCVSSPAGGTVTMNPKDGLVPVGKPLALSAKAAKNYVFHGWANGKDWTYSNNGFVSASASAKFENHYGELAGFSDGPDGLLGAWIDPVDFKIHIKAIFKAISAYREEDIMFYGVYGNNGEVTEPISSGDGSQSVDVYGVVGCTFGGWMGGFGVACGMAANPLVYKLDGKLPAGLKFDAKKGMFSGIPTKPGNTTVAVVATDPAKNSRRLLVNIHVSELPGWLVGDYRAMSCEYSSDGEWGTVEQMGVQNGLLELSVTAAGKVSAKYLYRGGTYSLSGSLFWLPDEDDPSGEGSFYFTKNDSKGYVEVDFADGGIEGYVGAYFKNGQEEERVHGKLEGVRHDASLLKSSNFIDKYYTFKFLAEAASYGYGYLTIKTDKKGGAKVTGQLPDGEKVSLSALLLPQTVAHVCCGMSVSPDAVSAKLFLFASPAAYKKAEWFAMALTLAANGEISPDECSVWTPAKVSNGLCCGLEEVEPAAISGAGAKYSEAKALEGYYWNLSCELSENVLLEYSYKYMEENPENPGKPLSWTIYDYANALDQDFDGYFFNVMANGDKKGAISLAEKNSALSFSFTKATGIFTGKATVYFDYDLPSYKQNRDKSIVMTTARQHKTASLPYAGVMIANGEEGYEGFGSALYSFKHTDFDPNTGKPKQITEVISLPMSVSRKTDGGGN